MTPGLQAAIERRYGLRLGPAQVLGGGYECQVWQVTSTRGPLVVRVSPTWRTADELAWVHELVRFTAATVPEAVAPVPAADGSTLFVYERQPVAIFPFIVGHSPERTLDRGCECARLLARLHRAMFTWPEGRPRPPSGADAPLSRPPSPDCAELHDPALDAWQAALTARPTVLTKGPIHGDYYPANLRCPDGRIIGVIDWDESAIDWLMQEVAWSAWEFTQTTTGDDLQMEWTRAFLSTYQATGGPCRAEEYDHVIPFIRWRLREEVRHNLGAADRGEYWDRAYMEQEVQAFQRLRDYVL